MKGLEGAYYETFENYRRKFSRDPKYAKRGVPRDGWINDLYIVELQDLLEPALVRARGFLRRPWYDKGSDMWKDEVHGWRRLIAIIHQEISFWTQGKHIARVARECNESIYHGAWYVLTSLKSAVQY